MKIVLIILSLIFLCSIGYFSFYYFWGSYKKPISPFIASGPVTSSPVSLILNLSSPDDNLLIFDADLLVQGKTSKGAGVIISSNEEDQIIEPGNQGNFSATLKLQQGVNNLLVSTFDNLGNIKSEQRIVYYSKEKL